MRIIRAVRAYHDATTGAAGEPASTPASAVKKLREDVFAGYDTHVLEALERIVKKSPRSAALEPAGL